jgi:hypothetical protein
VSGILVNIDVDDLERGTRGFCLLEFSGWGYDEIALRP